MSAPREVLETQVASADKWFAKARASEAEVERLREALAHASHALDEVVAYFDDGHRMPPAGFPLASVVRPAQRSARAALEASSERRP